MILLIDNYDSFTYNLYQAFAAMQKKVKVVRNDQVSIEEIKEEKPTHIILSPGPKTPNESGICIPLLKELGGKIPILGVCLGHQAIAVAFGGRFKEAKAILHGKTAKILHSRDPLFERIPSPFEAMRYHSLAVDPHSLPEELEVIAHAEDGEIMAIKHCSKPIYGVQFHPESILSPSGPTLLKNFLNC